MKKGFFRQWMRVITLVFGIMLAFVAPVVVSSQDFTSGTILVQAQGTIVWVITGYDKYTGEERTSSYSFNVPIGGLAGERARNESGIRARNLFMAENPGFVIIKASWY
jgi:hypothetical protein